MIKDQNFGRLFGQVMKRHPEADVHLVNDVLQLAFAEWGAGTGEGKRVSRHDVSDAEQDDFTAETLPKVKAPSIDHDTPLLVETPHE